MKYPNNYTRPYLTEKNVKAFHKYMAAKFKAEIVNKDDKVSMEIIDWALGLMGVMDKGEFLKRYAITIGDRIYIPYEIGKGTMAQKVGQIILICHEMTHVIQGELDHAMKLKYLMSKSRRAHMESEAMHCNLEMYYWYYQKNLPVSALVKALEAYSLRDEDIAVAQTHLKVYSMITSRGVVASPVSKAAIAWWGNRYRNDSTN